MAQEDKKATPEQPNQPTPNKPSSIDPQVGQSDELTQLEDKLKVYEERINKVESAAKSLGLGVDDFIGHSNQAFDVIANLINQGVIDQSGQAVKQEVTNQPGPVNEVVQHGHIPNNSRASTTDPALAALMKQQQDMNKVLNGMMEMQLRDRVKSNYPAFTDSDVDQVFNQARMTNQSIFDQAKLLDQNKQQSRESIQREIVEGMGMSYDDYLNKINEQTTGSTSSVFDNVSYSFDADNKDSTKMTPKKAALLFLKTKGGKE